MLLLGEKRIYVDLPKREPSLLLAARPGKKFHEVSSLPNPSSRARIMACARSATCSLVKMWEIWLLTVLGLRKRRAAILVLVWPWAMRPRISISRVVSSGKASAGDAGLGVEKKSIRRYAISGPK